MIQDKRKPIALVFNQGVSAYVRACSLMGIRILYNPGECALAARRHEIIWVGDTSPPPWSWTSRSLNMGVSQAMLHIFREQLAYLYHLPAARPIN